MNATRWMAVTGAAALPLGLVGLVGAAVRQDGSSAATQRWTQVDEAAQDPTPAAGGRLVRVGEREPVAEAEGFDAERWRGELAAADLERREASYERLLEIARRSPAARAALEAWAAGSDELAWTARMARRELERGSAFGWLGGGAAAPGRMGAGTFGGRELEGRLREIEAMLSDMRANREAWLLQGFPSAPTAPGMPGALHEQQQSYSIEVRPEGARIMVREQVDGDQETREYEGETLDEILRANPELEDKIRVRALDLDTQKLFGQLFDRGADEAFQTLHPFGAGEPPTDILGIECDPTTPEQADQHGLEPGLGLSVKRTEPGTIAHILGLKRGDVVVELNQIPIYKGDDVSRVLRERLREAPVAVTIVDSKGKRRTLTWKPSLAPR